MLSLDNYKTNIKLPNTLLIELEQAAVEANYSDSGYASSHTLHELLKKRITKTSNGPQKASKVPDTIRKKLESFLGVTGNTCSLLYNEPRYITEKHIDQERERQLCLTWAIAPTPYNLVAPTIFHIGDSTYEHYYDENGFILDTRIFHSMVNNDYTRILVQLTFSCELEELKSKLCL